MTVTHTYENGVLVEVRVQSGNYSRSFASEQWNDILALGDYIGPPILLDKMPALDDFKRLVNFHERTFGKGVY